MRRLLGVTALVGLILAGCRDNDITRPIPLDGPSYAQASTNPVVNNLADPGDGTCDDTECTLREAIAFADAGATIDFATGLTGTIILTSGVLTISKDLTITGPGATSLSVSGNDASQVFDIDVGVTASLSGLTITRGSSSGSGGGAIENNGDLTITASTISDSRAYNEGGGIYNDQGTLTITRSTISGNNAQNYGGGISNYLGTVTITESTISGNSTGWGGGGILHYAGEAGLLTVVSSTITGNTASPDGDGGGIATYAATGNTAVHTLLLNSTISGNTASGAGGGFENWEGQAVIILSTITGNQAGTSGGGVHNWPYGSSFADTDVKGSLIWGNTSGTGTADDVASMAASTFNSLGYNLIGAAGENVDLTAEFSATGDQTGVANAWLGPLANNGGPTQTHALLSGSPAINAGTCTDHTGTAVTTDQRGVLRPQGSTCDIGSYESEETSGLPAPDFSFDLSTLPAKTYGDPSFSVATYAGSTDSEGDVLFALGSGSVGCSVTSAGMVTLTGAATGSSYCILTAYLTSDGTYSSAGPISQQFNVAKVALTVTADDETITYGGTPSFGASYSGFVGSDDAGSLGGTLAYTFEGIGPTSYGPSSTAPTNAGTYSIAPWGYSSADYTMSYVPGTFTIGKAAGSVSIDNIPTDALAGGSFTPTYTLVGDGTPSTGSSTPAICTVGVGGLVSFIAEGTCTLVASITEGTNHFSATGSPQSFGVVPETLPVDEAIEALIEASEEAGLSRGTVNKLRDALKQYEAGRTGPAVNKLQEYITDVENQTGKKVTESDAEALIAAAREIIDAILS